MRIVFALNHLAFAAALSVASPAQDPVTPLPVANVQSAAFGEDSVCTDTDVDGTLWARGAAWKASFESAGASFIPFFGSDAPRNFPVKFRLAAARRGGHDLAVGTGTRPERQDFRVEYRHGDVVELYDLRPEGIEQSFRIDANPGSGDLVLEVALHTELAMKIGQDGFLLGNEHGHVRVTRSFAFDAAGNTLPVQESLDNGRITYLIAAADLEAAAFPVTVDPFISTILNSVDPQGTILNADVAFEGGSEDTAMVYEHVYSQADHDVIIRVVSAGGSVFTTYIDLTSYSWTRPSIAANRLHGQFLVAAERESLGSRTIWGRTLTSGSHVLTTEFQVSSGGGSSEDINPRVGGSRLANAGADHFAVIWERVDSATDHDILYRRWSAVTGGAGLGTQNVDTTTPTLDMNPAIAKSGRWFNGQLSWMVAWERDSGGQHDILGAHIASSSFGTFPVNTSSADTRRPAVSSVTDPAGGTARHVVVFEAPSHDIGLALMQGAQVMSMTLNFSAMEGVSNEYRSQPAVDSDGCRFVIAYRGETPGQLFTSDVFASTIHVAGGSLGVTEAHVALPESLALAARPSIAALRSGGGPGVRYVVGWHAGDLLASSTACDMVEYAGRTAGGGYTVLPTALQGLHLEPAGTPALGQPIAFTLQNSAGAAVIVAGLPIPPTTICSPLLLGVDVWNAAIILPAASLSATLPCDGVYLGLTFAVQGADIGGANGCANVRVSDTILVTIQ